MNGNLYYYVRNLQGDVTAIVDSNNAVVAQYVYDAYGKAIKVVDGTGADVSANATHIANLNPIRYRGYYYDTELQMYYLQSRYYDPQVGRFINADDASILLATEGRLFGANLFAYCNNNPIMNVDPSGYLSSGSVAKRGGAAITFLALLIVVIQSSSSIGAANFWNPVGWICLAVAGIAIFVFGVWSIASYLSDKSLKDSLSLINKSSTVATPPPPNKGGKGTRVASKTLYNNRGNRIDVENPGNRQGQIHLQQGKTKYYYNVRDQAFHINSSNGKLAPKSIQNLLKDKNIIKAISKGLKILGY